LYRDVIEFLQKQAQVEASSQALMAVKRWLGYSQNVPKQMTSLYLAAYFGVDEAVKFLIGSDQLTRTRHFEQVSRDSSAVS
jgi:hypothetical protein